MINRKAPLITTARLAKICGVSQGTVDRALNGRGDINPETKQRILDTANKYGYRTSTHGVPEVIGIIVFDLDNRYFSDLVTAIEAEGAKRGYTTAVLLSHRDKTREIECIETLYAMGVSGICLCPINKGEDFERFMLSLNMPVVTVGNRLSGVTYVGIDNFSAVGETVEHVAKKGYEKLLYVAPDIDYEGTNADAPHLRIEGFCARAQKLSLEHQVIYGLEKVPDLCNNTAVICSSDHYALSLMDKAKSCGAGIMGFDNIKLLDRLNIPLDSVAYDTSSAATSVLEIISTGKAYTKIIDYKIIKRGSI